MLFQSPFGEIWRRMPSLDLAVWLQQRSSARNSEPQKGSEWACDSELLLVCLVSYSSLCPHDFTQLYLGLLDGFFAFLYILTCSTLMLVTQVAVMSLSGSSHSSNFCVLPLVWQTGSYTKSNHIDLTFFSWLFCSLASQDDVSRAARPPRVRWGSMTLCMGDPVGSFFLKQTIHWN